MYTGIRKLSLLGLLLGLTLARCSPARQATDTRIPTSTPSAPTPPTDPRQDDFDVYLAILPEIYGAQGMWVIGQDIAYVYAGDLAWHKDELPALLPDTLADYSGNRQGYPLKEIFDDKDPRLVLVNRDDFFEKPSPENGLNCIWVRTECFNKPKFEAAYPGQRGIILLSRIGYNSDRTQALVTTMITNEQDTGKTYIILLAKENGQWKIADRYEVTWII